MLGRAVQADPIKPVVKAPRSERLKLKCDDLLSRFAFRFNLRRYSLAEVEWRLVLNEKALHGAEVRARMVGRCRLTL